MSDVLNSGKKALILDFDHTCYDTDAFLLFEIRQPIFNKFKVSNVDWETSYEETVKTGYSIEKHLDEISKVLGVSIKDEDRKEIIDNIDCEKYLYPDTISFVKKAKEMGYMIVLLSYGYESWQNKKVMGSGLNKFMDDIKYVIEDEHCSKAKVVGSYSESHGKVIFVDNKGANVDEVHREFPKVETYFMNRVLDTDVLRADSEYVRIRYAESRKIAEKEALPVHCRCFSLSEVLL
ncbi:MAG: HAD family hydrolase [Patescibacteria group bacterium]